MELTELCTKLKFEHLPAQLHTLCEQAAKRELNYPEFLSQALMTEWQARRLKGVERGLRLARFPYVKTLEQFDFSFQPAIDRKLIRELAGLAFVERAENLILLGIHPAPAKPCWRWRSGSRRSRPVIGFSSSRSKR